MSMPAKSLETVERNQGRGKRYTRRAKEFITVFARSNYIRKEINVQTKREKSLDILDTCTLNRGSK
jgi:hypothetical protein